MKAFDQHIPLYYQIKEDILHRINNGDLAIDTKLPSEIDLAAQYGVSRPTMRQALAELMQEGYLQRKKGRGTFVSRPGIVDNAQVFTSFEDADSSDVANQTRRIHHRVVTPSAQIRQEMNLSPEDRVYEITTIRGNDNEKLAVRTSIIPQSLAPGLLKHLSGPQSSNIYHFLEEHYGLVPISAEQRFQAVPCSEKDAALLGIHSGTPVMVWKGFIYGAESLKFARVRTVFRGDRFSFSIRQGPEVASNSPSPHVIGTGILDTIDGRIW